MLGAPGWTKLVNLRQETGIVPVSVRVQQVCADFMCRSLRRGRLTDLNAEVISALEHLETADAAQDGEELDAAPAAGSVAPSRYAVRLAQCLHNRGITAATARLQDPLHPDYVAPAPWEESLALVSLTTSTPKQR